MKGTTSRWFKRAEAKEGARKVRRAESKAEVKRGALDVEVPPKTNKEPQDA